MTVFHILFWF